MIKRITHKITSSAPASFIINKSKKNSLPGFRGIPLYDVVMFFVGQVKTVGMTERASAISFNLFMAIPPALIFMFTLIPLLPISHEFEEGLYSIIRDVIPGEKNNANLIHFLQDFINKPRNGLLSISFVLSMFFSSNAMMGIQRSFDKNYIGFRKRKGLQKRLAAIKVTFIIYLLVFVSVLLLVAQGKVLNLFNISPALRSIIINARWAVIVLLFFTCISYIYRHAPAVDKKWPHITPGSILATVLMLLMTLLFSWWVSRFGRYNELYGSIGTVLIMMALIFINSLVLLIGFELNVSITSLKKIADERKEKETGGATG
ncbi:MAG: YihY/virulence factor BrkB family protein [Chitinophagaceae bacterium]